MFKAFIPRIRIIFLLVFLSAAYASSGQVRGYIGVKGGGNFSSAYFEHTIVNHFINTTYIPGYNGGMIFKLFTHQNQTSFLNAGLQSGLYMMSKGWRQSFPTDEPDYITRMNYVEFPLEATVYAGKGRTKPFFTLGFYAEYLVGVDKDPDPNLDSIGNADFYPYMEDRDRKFGYGARLSLGVQHDFPFGTVHLDGFFTFSFRGMLEYQDLDTQIPDLANHFVFGFSLAYMVPFGNMEF